VLRIYVTSIIQQALPQQSPTSDYTVNKTALRCDRLCEDKYNVLCVSGAALGRGAQGNTCSTRTQVQPGLR
jgi:hypothetical protein